MTERAGLALEDSRVREHPRGTIVWISFTVAYHDEDGERIEEPIQTAGYYVADRGVRRVGIVGHLASDVAVHPTNDGATLECY